jgi:hypothetical protein
VFFDNKIAVGRSQDVDELDVRDCVAYPERHMDGGRFVSFVVDLSVVSCRLQVGFALVLVGFLTGGKL